MEGYLEGSISHWNTGAGGAHLCITREGLVVLTCELHNIPWHAGTSWSNGRTDFWRQNNINPFSIGIELEGFFTAPYTQQQIEACVRVGKYLKREFGIASRRTWDQIPGHHLHSELSSDRSDPGPHFNLEAILRDIDR